MIEGISIQSFTAFKRLDWQNHRALNVIVGVNDTGKSHLLKLLYSITKSQELLAKGGIETTGKIWADYLADKLLTVYLPKKGAIGSLVHRGESRSKVEVRFNNETYLFSFGKDTSHRISDATEFTKPDKNLQSLFFPPKEVMSIRDALKSQIREFGYQPWGFDATYHDLVAALGSPSRSGKISPNLKSAREALIDILGGSFSIEEDDFYFRRNGTPEKYSMWQTAEGFRRVGIFSCLINNRWISAGSILFFDEPESNLHPKAVRAMARILHAFSKAGVQIYLSTHSYFMLKQLEILARKENTDACLLSLQRTDGAITATINNLKEGLPDNPIVNESLEMFAEDVKLDLVP